MVTLLYCDKIQEHIPVHAEVIVMTYEGFAAVPTGVILTGVSALQLADI